MYSENEEYPKKYPDIVYGVDGNPLPRESIPGVQSDECEYWDDEGNLCGDGETGYIHSGDDHVEEMEW